MKTGFGGDDKPGWNGETHTGHFGQARSFPPEELLIGPVGFLKKVDIFRILHEFHFLL
jgi:hypothetical protein